MIVTEYGGTINARAVAHDRIEVEVDGRPYTVPGKDAERIIALLSNVVAEAHALPDEPDTVDPW